MTVLAAAGSDQQLGGLVGWVLSVIEALGAIGVGLLVALESIFPPIPSEVVLPLAGFLAGQGKLGFVTVLVWSTVGSLVGALALYWLGAALGIRRLCRLAEKMPLMDGRDVERAAAWFERHGVWAVLLGRMVPGVRSLVSIPAGVERMPLWLFSLLTVVGSAVWNALFIGLGWLLGDRWTEVGRYSDVLNYVVIGGIVLVCVLLLGRRAVRRRRGLDPLTGEPATRS
ncbi:MAG TPA: DedA family protein [Mycobacteriales bacterium]|nr:DedA family protein [Mycobacteriales bacterium]